MRQVPFLRLLIPVISGILFFKFISPSIYLFPLGILGLFTVLISFFISKKHSYIFRWSFGAGLMIFLFSLTIQFCQYRTNLSLYDFPDKSDTYIGEILDFPQQKRRSLACQMRITYPTDKKIMLYLEPDTTSQLLKPGDKILIHASVKPFNNLGNPDEFDYKGFMHNKGFSGSAYVSSVDWVNTGVKNRSVKSLALSARAKVLDIYKTYDLGADENSFLSAITLGYKADLTNDLKNAFSATGTSHVLAVSGLHVGIVYIIIMLFFSFLGKRGMSLFIKHLLILLCLWGYVFISGMSVSVIRAGIMLSLFSLGILFSKKGFTYNTLAIAAFFILIVNPFYLFDIGFQLSFTCVFSILFFQPKISKLYTPKYKAPKYVWNLFTVSLAAQLGAFPLVLFYFGTFPTYFFITNLLVLPLIGAIIYSAVPLIILSLLTFLKLDFLQILSGIIILFMQLLIKAVLKIVYFFEALPMAVLEGPHISIVQLILLFSGLFLLTLFLIHKRPNYLIYFLVSAALLTITNTFGYFKKPTDQFVVYNSYNEPDMGYRINGEKIALPISSNQSVAHPSASIVLLTENTYKYKVCHQTLSVDYLILSSDNSFSMYELLPFFKPRHVIIDSSIAGYAAKKLQNECLKLDLAFHDISNSGAFSVNF